MGSWVLCKGGLSSFASFMVGREKRCRLFLVILLIFLAEWDFERTQRIVLARVENIDTVCRGCMVLKISFREQEFLSQF